MPARLEGYRRGDLLARMVGDVDALQNLFLRGLTPPLVALLSGAVSVAVCAAYLPTAAWCWPAACWPAASSYPIVAALRRAALGRAPGAAPAPSSRSSCVELLRGAPELVVLGADRAALERVAALDAELTGLARAEALATGLVEGLAVAVVGLTVAGVLAVCIAATAAGSPRPRAGRHARAAGDGLVRGASRRCRRRRCACGRRSTRAGACWPWPTASRP